MGAVSTHTCKNTHTYTHTHTHTRARAAYLRQMFVCVKHAIPGSEDQNNAAGAGKVSAGSSREYPVGERGKGEGSRERREKKREREKGRGNGEGRREKSD